MKWRDWALSPAVLGLSALVTVILLVPLAIAYLVGGLPAALGVGLGYLALARPALILGPLPALGLAVVPAMAATVAVTLTGNPLAAACFAALACLLVAPANQLADGMLAGLPSLVAVLVSAPVGLDSRTAGFWVLSGAAMMVLVATRMPKLPSPGAIPAARNWRHAVVMAVAVAVTIYLVQFWQLPHGYWVALTLTVVLRPFDDQTWTRSWQRVLGTLGGALLGMILAAWLPLWGLLLAMAACLVLAIGYQLQSDYVRQVVFLTPAVVLLGPNVGLLATERVLATLIGAAVAAGLALGLAWWEQRRRLEGEKS